MTQNYHEKFQKSILVFSIFWKHKRPKSRERINPYLLFQPQSKMLTSLRTLTRRVATKRCFTSSSAALDELKTANKPKATNIHHFKVYRWDPDQDQDVSI